MSEMLEKVARAICIAAGENPDEDWRQAPGGPFAEVHLKPGQEARWRLYLPQARAAVEALREPSEGMVEAGWGVAPVYDDPATSPGVYFTAMIDHVLKES